MLIVCAAMAALFVVLYAMVRTPLANTFDTLERSAARQDMLRLSNAFDRQVMQLARTAGDWAPKDSTYAFMRGEHPSFANDITPDSLTLLDVDAIILVDEQGHLVKSLFVDDLGSAVDPDRDVLDAVLSNADLQDTGDPRHAVSGLLRTPGGTIIVAARSITSSNLYAPPEGTFIALRAVDDRLVNDLSKITRLRAALYPLDGSTLPADVQRVVPQLASGQTASVALSSTQLAAYTLRRDIAGNPVLIIQSIIPRSVQEAGQSSLIALLASIALAAFVATIVIAIVIDQSVLRRIELLGSEMTQVGTLRDLSARVSVKGTDEIACLAARVNETLAAIENAQGDLVGAKDALEERVKTRTAELVASQQRYRTLVQRLVDGIFTVDIDGDITFVNSRGEELVGCPAREILGTPFSGLVTPAMHDGEPQKVPLLLGRDELCVIEALMGTDSSRRLPVELRGVPLFDSEDRLVGTQWICRDITERRHFDQQLRHMANHDFLTNLYNRHFFESTLDLELADARRKKTGGAIVWLDLDGFKEINDTLGHRVGDVVLVAIAERLRAELRESTMLARLGGDEFALLLSGVGAEEAEVVAGRVLTAINSKPFSAGEHTVHVSASIGVVLYPQHGSTAEELLANADVAMYIAKASGRSRVHLHKLDAAIHGDIRSRSAWNERLTTAIEDGLFRVWAQPIIDARTRNTERYELLIRMELDGEIVMPAEFLPTAERLGIIHEIDRWMVEQAVNLLAENRMGDAVLEVNLSSRALIDTELLPTIERLIANVGIDPTRLGFEVTETAVIADISHAEAFISRLRDMGCRFSLDDFGSGFSSFYYLRHLPLDCLKIDGSFIRNLPRSPQDQHLVKAIVELCRGLSVKVAVECVEDQETLDMAAELGVDLAQGYHIGRPSPVEDLQHTLRGGDAS
jgi:diguanylate cyclase (GGDEF)-like protein/PAS domain S-box-containing protein